MPLTIHQDPSPLRIDEHGVVRIAQTRITLDQVIAPFRTGASPEEIAARFDTLELADVYGVIGHYLRHREAADEYLAEEAAAAEEARHRWAETISVADLAYGPETDDV